MLQNGLREQGKEPGSRSLLWLGVSGSGGGSAHTWEGT